MQLASKSCSQWLKGTKLFLKTKFFTQHIKQLNLEVLNIQSNGFTESGILKVPNSGTLRFDYNAMHRLDNCM